MNVEYVWPAIKLIFSSAFSTESVTGGMAGIGIMIAARYGIARGLFSNESGMGSAPIVAAAAKTKNPVRQALVSSSGTFWDTVIICAITGVVVVSSILSFVPVEQLNEGNLLTTFNEVFVANDPDRNGGVLTKLAFMKIPVFGTPILMVGLFAFAFSTILGWTVYSSRAIEYIFGYKGVKYFMYIYLVAVFAGSVISLNTVWTLADIFNALMAIPNLLALILLSRVLVYDTNKYLWGGRLDDEENPR